MRWLAPILLSRAFPYYGVTAEVASRDVQALPGMLDRFDAMIEDGVLDGAQLNAADFHIAPLVAGLMGLRDLGSSIAPRPVAALANRVLPAK
jgi:hypothetical protein